jgi:hypothetical protein
MYTEDKPINGKAIYTPKGAALEYGRTGCNFYTGCPHECEYCYLKRGITGKALGGNEVRLKKMLKDSDTAWSIFRREAETHIERLRETGVFFSFTTDPLILQTRDLTISAVAFLNGRNVPTWVLTKDATFLEDFHFQASILRGLENKDIAHFGFTLTGRDDMEPKACKNHDRIMAMRRMSLMGFPTFASIEPVIDWESAERIVREALPWCDHFKLGLRSGVKKSYYNIAQSGAAIQRIVQAVESVGKTIYLKESTRKLLQQYLQPGAYEAFLSHTVDLDGNRIPLH